MVVFSTIKLECSAAKVRPKQVIIHAWEKVINMIFITDTLFSHENVNFIV